MNQRQKNTEKRNLRSRKHFRNATKMIIKKGGMIMTEADYMQSLFDTWAEHWQSGEPITVSAQRYGQRHYTENELLSVSDDLIAEARRARETA